MRVRNSTRAPDKKRGSWIYIAGVIIFNHKTRYHIYIMFNYSMSNEVKKNVTRLMFICHFNCKIIGSALVVGNQAVLVESLMHGLWQFLG